MPNRRTRRRFRYLVTTSLIALAASIAPVSLDFSFDQPLGQSAQASSCFVAGTRVLMADYSERPIECIEIGDYVLGSNGTPNRVVAIERPLLGARKLYAFGDRQPFVTAEHPFFTKAGWKAIDPAATEIESPGLGVGCLKAFDEVAVACFSPSARVIGNLALAHPVELALSYQPVGRIRACEADPSTRVYNLLLDGDHAYFADGFLVHNKDGGSGSGSGSGGSGSGSGDGDGGSSGGEGGSGSSGDSSGGDSSGGDSSGGEGGEGGDDGSASSDSGGEGGEASSIGSVSQKGPDLSPSQEAEAISKGWQ